MSKWFLLNLNFKFSNLKFIPIWFYVFVDALFCDKLCPVTFMYNVPSTDQGSSQKFFTTFSNFSLNRINRWKSTLMLVLRSCHIDGPALWLCKKPTINFIIRWNTKVTQSRLIIGFGRFNFEDTCFMSNIVNNSKDVSSFNSKNKLTNW